jgi:hypothetical protein
MFGNPFLIATFEIYSFIQIKEVTLKVVFFIERKKGCYLLTGRLEKPLFFSREINV